MAERRNDYRIQGRAQVLIKLLDSAQSTDDSAGESTDESTDDSAGESTGESTGESARGYFMNENMMAFATAYEQLCERTMEATTRLKSADSELADVLSLLNQKLDLIEQRFHLSDSDKTVEPQDICLSASGASFNQVARYDEGCRMALRLTLLPGQSLIYTLAKCARCEQLDNGEYEIAVHFLNLGTQESKLLRRHIMQMEREFLRRDAQAASALD